MRIKIKKWKKLKKEFLIIKIQMDKIFKTFQKISSDGTYYHLRCKDRNCSGIAQFVIGSEDIQITKKMFFRL